MATKANQIRNIDKRKQAKAELKSLLGEETKAVVKEMRRLGFAPPKGVVTQKQFERYAAFLDAQATAAKATALNNEVAVFNANGGLMTSILNRLNRPGIKGTEFANLSTAAVRLLALAPTLADKSRAELAGTGDGHISDAELDALERQIMKGQRDE